LLLDYVTYTNLTGCSDFFNKLRLWAVSKGWTQEEWLENVTWGTSPYGWKTDSRADFLQLSKTGYGTQNLIAAISSMIKEDYPSCSLAICMRSQTAYETSSSKHPMNQNPLVGMISSLTADSLFYQGVNNACGGLDLTASDNIPQAWFFAGPHWICAVAKMSEEFCQMMHFGSFEMFEDNPSQGQCFGMTTTVYGPGSYEYDTSWKTGWERRLFFTTPFSSGKKSGFSYYTNHGLGFYYFNRASIAPYGTNYIYHRDNCHVYFGDYWSASSGGNELLGVSGAVLSNHFSAKRPMIKPIFAIQRPADSVWVPVFKAPVWCLNTAGLEIGQQLEQDGSKYLVFPFPTIYTPQGYAFCIDDGTLTTTTV
jgi:hypothetical protein